MNNVNKANFINLKLLISRQFLSLYYTFSLIKNIINISIVDTILIKFRLSLPRFRFIIRNLKG